MDDYILDKAAMTNQVENRQAGTEIVDEIRRESLVREVATMLSGWEDSDELAGEFARRLVDYLVPSKSIKD